MLKINSKAPSFVVPSTTNNKYSLKDSIGKYVVLYFYPKDDTPGCTKEACSLRDNYSDIKKLNANVVGISIDSSDSHKDFKEKYNLPFMLLSDPDGETAKKYGALNNFFIFKLAINIQGAVLRRSGSQIT